MPLVPSWKSPTPPPLHIVEGCIVQIYYVTTTSPRGDRISIIWLAVPKWSLYFLVDVFFCSLGFDFSRSRMKMEFMSRTFLLERVSTDWLRIAVISNSLCVLWFILQCHFWLNSAKIISQHILVRSWANSKRNWQFYSVPFHYFFLLSEMSSVPISKAYVSKRSNRVKSNPKWTSPHNQIEENNTSRLSPPESRKYRLSETFGSDCKVSVLWDASAVRLYVETRKWWTVSFCVCFGSLAMLRCRSELSLHRSI